MSTSLGHQYLQNLEPFHTFLFQSHDQSFKSFTIVQEIVCILGSSLFFFLSKMDGQFQV